MQLQTFVRPLLCFIIIICDISSLSAQSFVPYNEIGLVGGTSYYLGDLNKAHFNSAQIGGGLVFRRNIDRRFAYKAEMIFFSLEADDRENTSDPIATDRGLHFKSQLYEFSAQLEFNFLPYQPGNPLYTWTPFIYTGVFCASLCCPKNTMPFIQPQIINF